MYNSINESEFGLDTLVELYGFELENGVLTHKNHQFLDSVKNINNLLFGDYIFDEKDYKTLKNLRNLMTYTDINKRTVNFDSINQDNFVIYFYNLFFESAKKFNNEDIKSMIDNIFGKDKYMQFLNEVNKFNKQDSLIKLDVNVNDLELSISSHFGNLKTYKVVDIFSDILNQIYRRYKLKNREIVKESLTNMKHLAYDILLNIRRNNPDYFIEYSNLKT